MTQNKTTIQSGNNVLKAYNLDGVVTPSQGLPEWVCIDGAVNPSNWNDFEIGLGVLQHPIFLDWVSVHFESEPNYPRDLFISRNFENLNHATITTSENTKVYSVAFDQPIKPDDSLIFKTGDTIGAKITKIELRGYRIAFETIQANFGDV
jgi:hypothetical protein